MLQGEDLLVLYSPCKQVFVTIDFTFIEIALFKKLGSDVKDQMVTFLKL